MDAGQHERGACGEDAHRAVEHVRAHQHFASAYGGKRWMGVETARKYGEQQRDYEAPAAGGGEPGAHSPGDHGGQSAERFYERPSYEFEQRIQATRHTSTPTDPVYRLQWEEPCSRLWQASAAIVALCGVHERARGFDSVRYRALAFLAPEASRIFFESGARRLVCASISPAATERAVAAPVRLPSIEAVMVAPS